MYFNYLEKADPEITAAIKREINRLTTNISSGQMWKVREYVVNSIEIEGVRVLNLKYDNNMGLLLGNDRDYDIDSRFL